MPKVVDVEERRAELAAAAAQLIARSGVGAATLRDVAAEAGWTTGALTHYFADKRELLLFTFRASLAGRHAARDARPTDSLRVTLVQTLEGALPLDEERRRHWVVTIAFCAQAPGDADLSAAQRDAYREFCEHVTALCAALPRHGGLTAAEAAAQLITTSNGIAVQALFDPASWPATRQRDHLHRAIDELLPR